MDKTIKVLIIILLSILIVGSLGAFTMLFTKNTNFELYKTSKVYDNDIEEEFNAINVESDSLDIKIIKANNERTNVKIFDRNDKGISVKVEDNTLKIVDDNINSFCFMCFGKREAIISLPERVYDLVVESASGDISSSIDLGNVTIVSTSGDIDLKNTKDLTIVVTSGDIEVKEVDNISITSTSGDVEIEKVNNSLDIQTISGDIGINELTITKDSEINVMSGDVVINNSSEAIYVNAKATSGDIKIKDNNRRAEYELKIETTSGDIIVR